MEKEYLLSICIPTYNRAAMLEKTLESLVKQLDDDIEIVISDNHSTDETKEVGEKYANKYINIKYYRNEVNIRDANFTLSLDRGTGLYLKLMKDNIEMADGALRYLKHYINHYKESKIPLFFTNGVSLGKYREVYECLSFEDFIIHTSYLVTGITFFGCWRDQWSFVTERDKYSKLQLSQDDWIYQLLSLKRKAVLCQKKYFYMYDLGKRSGYNWFEVHVTNYYNILQPYVVNGLLDKSVIKKEKSIYIASLKPQLTYAFLYKNSSWNFDLSEKNSILWKHFKSIPRFYFVMIMLPFTGTWIIIKYKVRKYLIRKGVWDKIKHNKLVRKFV